MLEKINSPADIKLLRPEELEILAEDIRRVIIETCSKNGGHLAPSLGTVELTLALHYVFDAPRDKIVWDVGHQAYAHKLITGRRDQFHTLRKSGGVCGFPRREESIYDVFSVGHSSTSISACGRDRRGALPQGRKLQSRRRHRRRVHDGGHGLRRASTGRATARRTSSSSSTTTRCRFRPTWAPFRPTSTRS